MVHAITFLFNKFAFIYILCTNYASTEKKELKNSYPSDLNLKSSAVFQGFQNNIIAPKYRFAAQKIPGLALVLLDSMLCDRQKSVIIIHTSFFY